MARFFYPFRRSTLYHEEVKYLEKYQASIFSIALLFFTNFALSPGSDCDSIFSSLRYVALFAYFCFFLLSLLSWGTIFLFVIGSQEKSTILRASVGSLWISAIAAILLALHGVGAGLQPYFCGLLFFGVLLAELGGHKIFSQANLPQKPTISTWVLGSFLGFRFGQSTRLWSSTDPLFYHLLAPKLWLEQSKLQFIPNMPMLMQASYWEQLYLGLFQGIYWQPEKGLLEFQIIAQWLHCGLGYIGSALLLRKLLKQWSDADRVWINLATIAAIFCADLYWTAATAKNDWGICFWTLSGFFFLPIFNPKRKCLNSEMVLSGCFLGFAMGGKYSAAISILPIVVMSLLFVTQAEGWKYSIRKHGAILLIALFPVAFFLLRNFSLTGDPLFPAYTEHFQGIPIAKSTIELFDFGFGKTNQLASGFLFLLLRNLLLFCQKTYAPLLFIPLFLGKSVNRTKIIYLNLAFGSTILIYSLANLNVMRYLGPTLLICIAISVTSLSQIPLQKTLLRSIQIILFSLILWQSDFFATDHYGMDLVSDHPLAQAMVDVWKAPNAAIQIRQLHLAGEAKSWLRQNLKADETVMLSAENLSYYLPGGRAFAGFEDPQIDESARKANSLLELLPLLKARQVRYILDTRGWVLAPRIALSILCAKAVREFPDSIVFRDKDSQVIDLTILAKQQMH